MGIHPGAGGVAPREFGSGIKQRCASQQQKQNKPNCCYSSIATREHLQRPPAIFRPPSAQSHVIGSLRSSCVIVAQIPGLTTCCGLLLVLLGRRTSQNPLLSFLAERETLQRGFS